MHHSQRNVQFLGGSVNDDCCSKPLVNEENGKFETGASLTVHASCFDGYSTDTKPVNGEEIKRTDVGVSSDDQDVNESNEDGRHFDHTTAYDPTLHSLFLRRRRFHAFHSDQVSAHRPPGVQPSNDA
ncbi:hypothetical protein OIU84_012117 [Salix udensis]|uniref:Uncharacterized protein n=1 Tax=Salix udensis TaxID=889485 RepID=A0AAD6JF17_9ROSI|nr:hypothetical protein OIU84_012117 [Salix udensis]